MPVGVGPPLLPPELLDEPPEVVPPDELLDEPPDEPPEELDELELPEQLLAQGLVLLHWPVDSSHHQPPQQTVLPQERAPLDLVELAVDCCDWQAHVPPELLEEPEDDEDDEDELPLPEPLPEPPPLQPPEELEEEEELPAPVELPPLELLELDAPDVDWPPLELEEAEELPVLPELPPDELPVVCPLVCPDVEPELLPATWASGSQMPLLQPSPAGQSSAVWQLWIGVPPEQPVSAKAVAAANDSESSTVFMATPLSSPTRGREGRAAVVQEAIQAGRRSAAGRRFKSFQCVGL